MQRFKQILFPVDLSDLSAKIVPYLVIMGTHGRKGIDEIMLGNVAHRVIKNSPVPVLTVNPYLASK